MWKKGDKVWNTFIFASDSCGVGVGPKVVVQDEEDGHVILSSSFDDKLYVLHSNEVFTTAEQALKAKYYSILEAIQYAEEEMKTDEEEMKTDEDEGRVWRLEVEATLKRIANWKTIKDGVLSLGEKYGSETW